MQILPTFDRRLNAVNLCLQDHQMMYQMMTTKSSRPNDTKHHSAKSRYVISPSRWESRPLSCEGFVCTALASVAHGTRCEPPAWPHGARRGRLSYPSPSRGCRESAPHALKKMRRLRVCGRCLCTAPAACRAAPARRPAPASGSTFRRPSASSSASRSRTTAPASGRGAGERWAWRRRCRPLAASARCPATPAWRPVWRCASTSCRARRSSPPSTRSGRSGARRTRTRARLLRWRGG